LWGAGEMKEKIMGGGLTSIVKGKKSQHTKGGRKTQKRKKSVYAERGGELGEPMSPLLG